MNDLKEIINKIGDFNSSISELVCSFLGVLRYEDQQVILEGRIDLELLNGFEECKSKQIWGYINKTPVTLLNCSFKQICWRVFDEPIDQKAEAIITLCPSEIIIGKALGREILVKEIYTTMPALNLMFHNHVFEPLFDFSREKPSVLEYTYPRELSATDKYGTLRVYRTFNSNYSRDAITYNTIPRIEYRFTKATKITDAIGRIASVRNFFSFFANHYIPLDALEFRDADSMNEEVLSQAYSLFFNDREKIVGPDEPFLISSNALQNDFKKIWNNWVSFYDEAKHVVNLFYEVICDHSTYINRFLNMAQAVEVYSCRYREQEAKAIQKQNKSKKLFLKHRIEDIERYISDCFAIKEEWFTPIAQAISDMRNFFTHYDKNRIEPSYDEIFSGSYFLRFTLLVLVYKKLGIANETIADYKTRIVFGRLNDDCNTLINYFTRSQK